jgi:hypothetical protein
MKQSNSCLVLVLFLVSLSPLQGQTLQGAEIVEHDSKYGFTVKRPTQWINQTSPFEGIRIMLGIEGKGYVGNCNVVVAEVPETSNSGFQSIDENVNKKPFPRDHFLPALRLIGADVNVVSATSVRRGNHSGQLVNYTYSYLSQALGKKLHGYAELFSHSRPGRNYAFTCVVFGLTQPEARRAFEEQATNFRRLSASFRTDE